METIETQPTDIMSDATPLYTVVVKVGGNELDDPAFLDGLVLAIRTIQQDGHTPVIVHGGGKTIAQYQEKLGLEAKFIDGLRVTDEASMEVAEMVLSGLTNKRIVRALVNAGIRRGCFPSDRHRDIRATGSLQELAGNLCPGRGVGIRDRDAERFKVRVKRYECEGPRIVDIGAGVGVEDDLHPAALSGRQS